MSQPAVKPREPRFGKSFDAVDADHDEVTTLADWEDFAMYLCSQFGQPFYSAIGRQVRDAVLSWWYRMLGRVDGVDQRRLTRTDFAAHYGGADEAVFEAIIPGYVDAIFALCDGDGDGLLSRQEFAALLRAHGVAEREMTRTMRELGFDRIGHVSRQAYADLLRDFCLGTNAHSPGTWLFGAA